MKLTTPSLKKIRWLLQSPVFRKSPISVLTRIFHWEWLRICNKGARMRYDKRFQIDLLPNEGASRLTYYFGLSEPELFQLYNEFLKPGMVVFDVGANIGLHALYMANRVTTSGKVFAFEPLRSIFKRLETHVLNNQVNNIYPQNCALGAEPGVLSFSENKEDTSRSFVFKAPQSAAEESLIPVETIDRFVQRHAIERINFLKIDVEGFEEDVLKGATESLAASIIDILQVELDENSLSRNGSTAKDAIELLTQRGYSMARWDNTEKIFRPTSNSNYNTFFVQSRLMESPKPSLEK